jgi:Flp pilus assembly protein TadG
MSLSNTLRRFQQNESGNVMAICAALMPLLMGSAALAVDATQIALWKRQLQRAVDSAAIAGAYTLTQNGTNDQVETAVDDDLDENPHPPIADQTVIIAPAAGFQQTVRVALTSQRTLPFASIFTNTPTTIAADATAAIVTAGDYCMVSLYSGPDTGIDISGNATVTLGCGMIANSRSSQAVTASGSSSVTASPVGAVGGLDGRTQNFEGETVLLPYSAPQADPYGYLPDPEKPAGKDCTGNAPIGEVIPGGSCYASWNVGSGETLLLGPGTHYIYGGDSTFHGTVKTVPVNGVEGATVILTGPSGKAGDIKTNAQASIQIKPSTDGTYKGVTFYRDRRADFVEIKMNGGSDAVYTGGYYFPSADLWFNGNANITSNCLQMVAQKLTFRGTFDLANTCADGPNNGNFRRRLVRLVE